MCLALVRLQGYTHLRNKEILSCRCCCWEASCHMLEAAKIDFNLSIKKMLLSVNVQKYNCLRGSELLVTGLFQVQAS